MPTLLHWFSFMSFNDYIRLLCFVREPNKHELKHVALVIKTNIQLFNFARKISSILIMFIKSKSKRYWSGKEGLSHHHHRVEGCGRRWADRQAASDIIKFFSIDISTSDI